MNGILTVLLVNAGVATLLAMMVAMAGRVIKRPAVVHVLWVIVLLKLLSPPVFEVGVIPQTRLLPIIASDQREPGIPSAERVGTMMGSGPVMSPVEVEGRPAPGDTLGLSTLVSWGLALWLVGTVSVLALVWMRGRRFKRLLAHSKPAPKGLQAITTMLAARMGLGRAPEVLAVDARISPMIWPRLGSLKLLFPSELLGLLSRREREALVAHELAHVARRDHWVRYLELMAGCGFWWHPVVWWARSRLRAVEEQCCDALVLRTLPGRSRAYAQALLKTLEFLAGYRPMRPALASGAGEIRRLEERLTMIMKQAPNRFVSRPYQLALALLGLGALLIFPTWADLLPSETQKEERVETQERYRSHVMDLERQAVQLEEELREVRARQLELEQQLRQLHRQEEVDRLREHAVELETTGKNEDARGVREELAVLERQFDLEREHHLMEQDLLDEMGRTEAELRRAVLEIELDRAVVTFSEAQVRMEAIEEAKLNAEMDRMRSESRRLREAGRVKEARHMEDRIDLLRAESELARARDHMIRFEISKAKELMYKASKLEEKGRFEEAMKVRKFLEQLLENVEEEEEDQEP